jgi:heme/copper-type cytochrome/quinol oxidase subunit 2
MRELIPLQTAEDNITFLAFTLLIFIVIVFYLSARHRNNNDTKPEKEPPKKQKTNVKSYEVIDTLNWLLAMNIIDSQTYNKIIGKAMQFWT